MSSEQWVDANRRVSDLAPRLEKVLVLAALVGLVALIATLAIGGAREGWKAYWVNFIFWMGLAQAGVVLAAIVHIVQGRWGGTVIRLGLLQVAFLPVAAVLFIGMMIAAGSVLPWVAEPVEGKEWWLNLPFFLIRNLLAMAVMCGTSLAFAYFTLRPEVGVLREKGIKKYPEFLTRGWRGAEAERERSQEILSWLAPVLVFIYAMIYTLFGFDMVMSLDPHWYSNLFGGYFFITTLYTGIAAVILLSALVRTPFGLEKNFTSKQFHDLGKLLLAFCLLSTDFLWSQFLVIWYGDLPEEIGFVIDRMHHEPWKYFSYVVFFGGFVIPFIILLNRRVKEIPFTIACIALVVLTAGFAERLLMILPSLAKAFPESTAFPAGPGQILISLGFAGLYGLSVLWALKHAPVVPAETPPANH